MSRVLHATVNCIEVALIMHFALETNLLVVAVLPILVNEVQLGLDAAEALIVAKLPLLIYLLDLVKDGAELVIDLDRHVKELLLLSLRGRMVLNLCLLLVGRHLGIH